LLTSTLGLYGKTASVLPSSQNDPPKGNSPILSARPNAKPLIVCGDDVFKWYDADQEPAPGLGKVEDQKDFKLRESVGRKPVGAFYHADRWWYKETKMSSPGICIGAREAVMSATDDVLIICPVMLTDAGKARPTPRDVKATVAAQADFMKLFVSTPSVMFHELMHWFGGVNNVNGRLEHSKLYPMKISSFYSNASQSSRIKLRLVETVCSSTRTRPVKRSLRTNPVLPSLTRRV
jgi:hypothetical protein